MFEFVVTYAVPLLLAGLFFLVVGAGLLISALQGGSEEGSERVTKAGSGAYADKVQEGLGISGWAGSGEEQYRSENPL